MEQATLSLILLKDRTQALDNKQMQKLLSHVNDYLGSLYNQRELSLVFSVTVSKIQEKQKRLEADKEFLFFSSDVNELKF